MGSGFANPHTLISVRLLLLRQSRRSSDTQSQQPVTASDNASAYDPTSLLTDRLRAAYQLRSSLFDKPWYRLVHAEGDLLPGLIVDRYDSVLMVQITTAGLEHHRLAICDYLAELTGCSTVHLANRVASRELEQLPSEEETPLGQLPDQLTVREQGCDFKVASRNSQKTGWFYDHRSNRKLATQVVAGKRVLDVFCYAGGWSISAAVAGAESVVCIDSSETAITSLKDNAAANGVAAKIRPLVADAIEALKSLQRDAEEFDVIILDPPAFIKRKKDYDKGVQHYELLNRLACRLLAADGLLITASCSQALQEDALTGIARRAAAKQGKTLQVLHRLTQGPDHPVLAGVPETHYLKGLMARLA